MLEITCVTRTFQGPSGGVAALQDVSLAVGAGEFVAVQGPSGCGKTTLLLVAGALLRPGSGSATINGTDVYSLSAEDRSRFRASNVGFVFQQFHLVPYLTVLENVLAASLASPRPDAEAHARELIGRFQLNDRIRHLPAQLSTGERQRTALARALLNRPGLLLADEPTGNLDTQNAQAVLDALVAFKNAGGAVLLVTHDKDAAASADRRVQMQGGMIQA